jgi:acyl carrier protein
MNKEELIKYIVDEYVEDDSDVTENTKLISGGIIDSFSIVSLKGWLEKKAGITIPDDMGTVENFETVNKILALVEQRKNA